MAFETKELQGSLFKNTKREKDGQPNMTGSAKIDGVEYWVSGWTKGEGDRRWISLAFKPKDGTVVVKDDKRPGGKEPKFEPDEIPF
jgi:hypothetical protein